MQKNILEYLEKNVNQIPDKTAFASRDNALSYRQLYDISRSVGSYLIGRHIYQEPVIVLMDKTPEMTAILLGIVYAGCIYVPLDPDMPKKRIISVINRTGSNNIIYDDTTKNIIDDISNDEGIECNYYDYRTLMSEPIDRVGLQSVRDRAIDTDPVYILFTSGSTGTPKGVIGIHRGIIDYIDQLTELIGINADSVLGSQAPFYFDASMKDIYPVLKQGATTVIIPKELFMTPIKLVEYLNEYRINTLCWVVSALTMISAYRTFETVKPEFVKTVAFVGEVFPIKQFLIWQENNPDVQFYNLYGPTEGHGVVCCYKIPKDIRFDSNDVIPIGKPFPNTDIILLTDDGRRAGPGEEGELLIRGSAVTYGYYNDSDVTEKNFRQNPLNNMYREIVYYTGDIARYDEEGNLVFTSRKDHQIKHMGQRIELGELDAAAALVDGVRECCAVYIREEDKLLLSYSGDVSKSELMKAMKLCLQRYMLPNVIIKMDKLPVTSNGKIDRMAIAGYYYDNKKNR